MAGLGAAGFGAGFARGFANTLLSQRQENRKRQAELEDQEFSVLFPLRLQHAQETGSPEAWTAVEELLAKHNPAAAKALKQMGPTSDVIGPFLSFKPTQPGAEQTPAALPSRPSLQAASPDTGVAAMIGVQPTTPDQTQTPQIPSRPSVEAIPPTPRRATFFGVPMETPGERLARSVAATSAVETAKLKVQEQAREDQARRLMAQDPSLTMTQAMERLGYLHPPAAKYASAPAENVIYEVGTGKTVRQGSPKAAVAGTFADYLTRYAEEQKIPLDKLTTKDVEDARKRYQQADDRPLAGQIGATLREAQSEDIATAIVNGDQPPDLSRLYGMAGSVRAKLAEKGYNLTRATQDWQATQRYLGTLNSAQQVRLRQATEFVAHSVPLVRTLSEDLSKQLPRSRFPILNSAALTAAQAGALGPDAQVAATNLGAQIRDLQAELAVMFRGGYAPTNESLKQAGDMLRSNWSAPQLKAALGLIEKNVTIRLNSLRAAGVSSATPGNPYAPDQAESAPPPVPSHETFTVGGFKVKVKN